jgi:pimeloyl-ACP methyl ester carboxylesterase
MDQPATSTDITVSGRPDQRGPGPRGRRRRPVVGRFTPVDIILIPGLWLDGSSWDEVVPLLEQAGHRTHALTLPGMESKDADRSKITLRDHIDAVIGAVDALEETVVLVGHSAGGPLAYAAADARPDRVVRIIYVGSEPSQDAGDLAEVVDEGDTGGGFPVVNGEVPLPEWSFFDEETVADLDDAARAAMRERSVPSPVRVTRDRMRLHDERRWDVPATVVACEYSSAQLREWTAAGAPGTQELARLHNVEYVDLDCGHWPQFTRPADLARVILASIDPA